MLLFVCFRCIQVFTSEKSHHCLPSNDDEDSNDTVNAENVLLIDYEPVNFYLDFTKSKREASIQMSGGDFNLLPGNRSTSINEYFCRIAPNRYASTSDEYSSLLALNRQSRTQTSDEFFNLLGHNRSSSENNSSFHLETFVNTTFNECQVIDKVINRTLDSNIFLSSGRPYQDFNQDFAGKEILPSASQTAKSFNSGDLEKNTCHISTANHLLEPDVLNVNMQSNSQDKRSISSRPIYNQKSKPLTNGCFLKHSEIANAVPRLSVNSSPSLSGDECRKNIPNENMPEKDVKVSILQNNVCYEMALRTDRIAEFTQNDDGKLNFAYSSYFQQHSMLDVYPKNIFDVNHPTDAQEKGNNHSPKLSSKKSHSSVKNPFSEDLNTGYSVPQQRAHSSHQPTQDGCIKNASNQRTHLLKHSVIPRSKKVYRCMKCRKWFRSESIFNAHVQNRCDPNPFKCDKCDEKCAHESKLIQHQKVHMGVKPFPCGQCAYASAWEHGFKAHLKTHSLK